MDGSVTDSNAATLAVELRRGQTMGTGKSATRWAKVSPNSRRYRSSGPCGVAADASSYPQSKPSLRRRLSRYGYEAPVTVTSAWSMIGCGSSEQILLRHGPRISCSARNPALVPPKRQWFARPIRWRTRCSRPLVKSRNHVRTARWQTIIIGSAIVHGARHVSFPPMANRSAACRDARGCGGQDWDFPGPLHRYGKFRNSTVARVSPCRVRKRGPITSGNPSTRLYVCADAANKSPQAPCTS